MQSRCRHRRCGSDTRSPVRAGAVSRQRTRLVLLGTSGGPPYWPGSEREGISSAVVVGDRYYLVDAGHGVMRRLRGAELGPNFATDLDGPLDALGGIFLTHLHSDHVVDLNNILTEGIYNGLQHVEKIPVYGPGNRGVLPPLFGEGPAPEPVAPGNPTPGTREMTDLLVQAFATDFNDRLFDNRKPAPDALWEAFDVPVPAQYLADPNGNPCPDMEPFTFFEDDRVRVSAILVDHAPVFPALAYRFDSDDGSIVFSGDTGPTPNLVKLARGADVLVHEVIDPPGRNRCSPNPARMLRKGSTSTSSNPTPSSRISVRSPRKPAWEPWCSRTWSRAIAPIPLGKDAAPDSTGAWSSATTSTWSASEPPPDPRASETQPESVLSARVERTRPLGGGACLFGVLARGDVGLAPGRAAVADELQTFLGHRPRLEFLRIHRLSRFDVQAESEKGLIPTDTDRAGSVLLPVLVGTGDVCQFQARTVSRFGRTDTSIQLT